MLELEATSDYSVVSVYSHNTRDSPAWVTFTATPNRNDALAFFPVGAVRGTYLFDVSYTYRTYGVGSVLKDTPAFFTLVREVVVPNFAPTLSGGPGSVLGSAATIEAHVGPTSLFNLTAACVDPEADSIVFGITGAVGLQAPSFLAINPTGLLTVTPQAGAQGRYLFNLTCTDVFGAMLPTTVTLNVLNRPPQIPAQLTVRVAKGISSTQEFALVGVSDPDGDTYTLSAVTALPKWARFDGPSARFSFDVTAAPLGTYTFRVAATDRLGAVSAATDTTVVVRFKLPLLSYCCGLLRLLSLRP